MNPAPGLRLASHGSSSARRSLPAALATLLALTLVLAAALALLVPHALADEPEQVGHAQDGSATYSDVSQAWAAATSGTTVVMDADWYTGSQLIVPSGSETTLRMNGHKVWRDAQEVGEGSVFWLEEKATLTLDGTGACVKFFYTGYGMYDLDPRTDLTVTSGGLVTGGNSTNSGGGIEMKGSSKLYLINVAVAGNKASATNGGGVAMYGSSCELHMTDATIEHNVAASNWTSWGGCGGGVYCDGEYATVEMDNSWIQCNYARKGGGGLYADDRYFTMKLDKSSTVNGNVSIGCNGGGLFLYEQPFEVTSSDGTGKIENNCAKGSSSGQYGGGIYTSSDVWGDISIAQRSTIYGITFEENTATGGIPSNTAYAGGVYIDQRAVTIENCTFANNTCNGSGGALYLNGRDCTVVDCSFYANVADTKYGGFGGAIYSNAKGTLIEDCSITGNSAELGGGGVFSNWEDNIRLKGLVYIYDNARYEHDEKSADDLFLDTTTGQNIYAYVVCSDDNVLEEGSWVGIRTDVVNERRMIVTELDEYIPNIYFPDSGSAVHFTYSAQDKTLYQEPYAQIYTLSIDGTVIGSFDAGKAVTIDARKYGTDAFVRWDEDTTTGLWSFEGAVYKPENPVLTITMPCCDVGLGTVRMARLDSVSIEMGAVTAGEALPATATAQGEAGAQVTATVYWEKLVDGELCPAQGVAEAGCTYVATVTAPQDAASGVAYALDMGADAAALHVGGGADSLTQAVWVSRNTGALEVTSAPIAAADRVLASVEAPGAAGVKAGADEAALAALVPATVAGRAEDGSLVELPLDAAGVDWAACADAGGNALLGADGLVAEPAEGEASRTCTVAVAVAAPAGVAVPESLASVELRVVVSHADRTVSFEAGGGGGSWAQAVPWGEPVACPEPPAWEGHALAGWYAQGSEEPWDFSSPVTSDVTLTARWAPALCTVTFDAADGGGSRAVAVAYGQAVAAPQEPALEGFGFLGWYAQGSEEPWDFSSPVTSDVTLTARWSPVECTVTFDAGNGGEARAVAVAYGRAAAAPDAPELEGALFLGWYTGQGLEWDFSWPVTSDLALTARWAEAGGMAFRDVPDGEWYAGWVYRSASLGLMSGYRNGIGAYTGYFGPEDLVTRGQVATVLWRMAGSPSAPASPFPQDDVPGGEFYSQAVAWCYWSGVVTGYESGPKAGTFRPGDPVSREELALMVYRFEAWAGVATSGAPAAAFEACSDREGVAGWARDAAVWCAAAGVMEGKDTAGGARRLDPQQTATRAQAAKMLVRACLIYRGEQPYEPADGQAGSQDAQAQAGQQAAAFEEVATFDDVAAPDGATAGSFDGSSSAGQAGTADADVPSEPATPAFGDAAASGSAGEALASDESAGSSEPDVAGCPEPEPVATSGFSGLDEGLALAEAA